MHGHRSLRLLFFDSGIGGMVFGSLLFNSNLAQLKPLIDNGHSVELTYFCDNKNEPYCGKDFHDIVSLGNKNLSIISQESHDAYFIACNTVSSHEKHFNIPHNIVNKVHFLTQNSIIAITNAITKLQNEQSSFNVSIWATARTIKNGIYQNALQDLSSLICDKNNDGNCYSGKPFIDSKINLHTFSPQWSVYIQNDLKNGTNNGKLLIKKELEFLLDSYDFSNRTTIVCLYCTHFPFYINIIREAFINRGIFPIIIEQGNLFGNVVSELINKNLLKNGTALKVKHGLPSNTGALRVNVVTTGKHVNKVQDVVTKLHNYKIEDILLTTI
ncbi:MAG: hypothetical protein JJW01_00815 [Alphaproteobacteria bacterium]|nr:hypothetical protein [Rickettsiales bacterium]